MGIFGIIFGLFFFAAAYVAFRLFGWLKTFAPRSVCIAGTVVFILLLLAAPFALYNLGGSFGAVVRDFGFYVMGVFLYAFLLTIVADLVLLLARAFGVSRETVRKRGRFGAGVAVVCLTVCVSAYGFVHAQDSRIVPYEIDAMGEFSISPDDGAVTNASANTAVRPLRVALISDLHLGATATEAHFSQVVDQINEQHADVVCIAGDLFNNDFATIENPEALAESFARIQSRYGVYACLGNHDCGNGFDRMLDVLKQGKVTVLSEDYATVADRFIIVGRSEARLIRSADVAPRGSYQALEQRMGQTDLPVIVLDHNPQNIHEYDAGVSLVLCGHTHAGQVFPGNFITGAMYDVDHGLYQQDAQSPMVVVTSGVGYWGPPMRVATDSEIVMIDLR